MDEKTCPLRSLPTALTDGKFEASCQRERCAWWCHSDPGSDEPGTCSIKLAAIALMAQATK